MYYVSTRDISIKYEAADAIVRGLAPDGGLLTPEVLPNLSRNALSSMCDMSYQQRAVYVMGSFLQGFSASELSIFANKAYQNEKFDVPEIAPLRKVDEPAPLSKGIEECLKPEKYYEPPLINVIPFACNACPEKSFVVSENCRGCLAPAAPLVPDG